MTSKSLADKARDALLTGGSAPGRSISDLAYGSVIGGAALKAHKVSDMLFTTVDTWQPVVFESMTEGEQLDGIKLRDDWITLESEVIGLYFVSGCVRPLWGGPNGTVVTVASRIVNSFDGGDTFVENRCLQAVEGRAQGSGELGTMHYMGTVNCKKGSLFRLEAKVSSLDMRLAGWPGFDNPVSVSIQAHRIGKES